MQKTASLPTEVFVAPHLGRQALGHTAHFWNASQSSISPQWDLPPVVLLCMQGTLGSKRAHSGGPASMTGLRTQTRWLPTTGVSKSAGRTHPCLGCLALLCTPQQAVGPWLGSGLGRLFWDLSTRPRAPVHIRGFKLQLILGESGLPCDFFLHLKIH